MANEFQQIAIYFLANILGKTPFIFFFLLTWSGVILGISGQAQFLLAYSLFIILGYGVIRGGLTALSDTQESIIYSIPQFIDATGVTQETKNVANNVASAMLGIPSNILSSISSDFSSFTYRYLFSSFPDAIVAPAFFFLGYGIAGSSISDSRNFPALFISIIGIIIQSVFFNMNSIFVLLNILFGIGFGILFGSYVPGDPVYGPYSSVPSQSLKIVLPKVPDE
jgi:hypothetical protein